MRARWHVLAAGMAALLLLPDVTLADNPSPPYWYITPVAGLATFDNAQKFPTADLKDELMYGGRIGRRFSNRFSFEAAGGYSSTQEDITNGADVKYLHLGGDLRFHLDPKSSFELSYTSHSGELRDELNLAVKHAPRRKHGMASGWLEATFGKGEGVIEADAFSGNLLVRKK